VTKLDNTEKYKKTKYRIQKSTTLGQDKIYSTWASRAAVSPQTY